MTTNNETTNEEVNNKEAGMSEEKWAELIKAVHHNGLAALKMHFNEVEAQVSNIVDYGPVFVFNVKDESGSVYSCGFFLRELIARFQSDNDPAVWLASFFVDLMETEGGKPLPKPATNEDEAKEIIDKVLVPQCIKAVTEEFAPEQVHAGLAWKEDHGPIFEVGFPAIIDGNNVCAVSLHLLLTHLQLNRDPGELLIQGLYDIRYEHGLE
ncbi:hypothetical protein AB4Z17_20640 [Paenibacillus sp. TAF43_2]|uniref:hypothetical protein n=1 Tax=Paenibacillus sp. TAF43_2 TaxID=3233069 RepID=UPI003F9C93ED